MPRLFLHSNLLERVYTADHLVEKHAKTPPVDRKAMTIGSDNFRRQILRRAAEGVRLSISRLLNLTQAKISQLKVSLVVKQHIFRLQVTVNDSIRMQVTKS